MCHAKIKAQICVILKGTKLCHAKRDKVVPCINLCLNMTLCDDTVHMCLGKV